MLSGLYIYVSYIGESENKQKPSTLAVYLFIILWSEGALCLRIMQAPCAYNHQSCLLPLSSWHLVHPRRLQQPVCKRHPRFSTLHITQPLVDTPFMAPKTGSCLTRGHASGKSVLVVRGNHATFSLSTMELDCGISAR